MASKRGEEEEEDLTEEMKNLRELQRQELSKVWGRAGGWAPCSLTPSTANVPSWLCLIRNQSCNLYHNFSF